MDSTFDTTNQREGEVGSVRSLIRKWRDTVSEAANGRQGGWIPSPPPWERRRKLFRFQDQALHPWSKPTCRGEPSLQPLLAVALRPTAFQTPEGKVTAALGEPAARRPQARLLGAPPTRRPVGAL